MKETIWKNEKCVIDREQGNRNRQSDREHSRARQRFAPLPLHRCARADVRFMVDDQIALSDHRLPNGQR